MTHNQLKRILWHTACPIEVDEPEESLCQNCQEPFWPLNGEWFCPECDASLPEYEKSVLMANAKYWLEHGGAYE